MLLPIDEDDTIDWKRLVDEIELLIEAKLDGIYSNGTACEFHNQTEHEFDKVQQILAESCWRKGMPFQIGASHPSPIITLERIKRTVALKPDAFQVILPDWVIVSLEEQIIYLQKIAEVADRIPIVLYNPPHAKTVLNPEGLHQLKKAIPQLIGIKVAGGDAGWYQQMRPYASEMAVFVPGHLLASGVKEGVASGAYSNVACIHPAQSQKWWQSMQSDLESALEVESRILSFFEACITPFKNKGYSNPALDKFLAAVGGWTEIGTRLRWPYKWIPELEVVRVRAQAKEMIPEFIAK